DFGTLAAALRLLQKRAPDVTCDVVANPEHRAHFGDLRNVNFCSGISDVALRQLYHNASISVSSLTGAAANNAILESMASGLPIIATDLPAIREHTTRDGCVYIPPGDSSELASAILRLLDDEQRCALLGAANRAHAAGFGWEHVARQTMEVY